MKRRITGLLQTIAMLMMLMPQPAVQAAASINIGDYVQMGTYYSSVGVRPAFYLNTECAIFKSGTGEESDPYTISGIDAEPDVYIDGDKIEFSDQNAVIIDDVTLVPARDVFETMGCNLEWNGDDKTVTVTSKANGKTVVITIGSYNMRILTDNGIANGTDEGYMLEVPAQIINDRTMIPLRAAAEAMDCGVQWDGENCAVRITTNKGDASKSK